MAKPAVYGPPIAQTNSSVQSGNKNAKNGGKAQMRFPDPPKPANQTKGVTAGIKHRAYTPGGPTGS